MGRITLFAAAALLVCQQAFSASPTPPQHFLVVLDCSQDMRSTMVAPQEVDGEGLTRLDIAAHAVKGWLAQLALRQKHAVSLLLGDDQKNDVAGEGELRSQDLMKYVTALENAAANDASPLQAIRRAAEMSSGDNPSAIVFLTGNDASPERTETCLALLQAAETPIHVISLGNGPVKQQPYLKLARASGGSMYQATDERQALAALCTTAGLINAGRVVRSETLVAIGSLQDPTTDAPETIDKEGTKSTPIVVGPGGKTPTADIVIDVTYYNQGIKDAKIYLRGENFDIVYDRSKERQKHWYSRVGGTYSDAKPLPEGTLGVKPTVEPGGAYIFEGVPFGKYKMEVFAVVKNRAYIYEREFVVEKPNKEFLPYKDYNRYRFKVLLEKTKDKTK